MSKCQKTKRCLSRNTGNPSSTPIPTRLLYFYHTESVYQPSNDRLIATFFFFKTFFLVGLEGLFTGIYVVKKN